MLLFQCHSLMHLYTFFKPKIKCLIKKFGWKKNDSVITKHDCLYVIILEPAQIQKLQQHIKHCPKRLLTHVLINL